MTLVEFLTARLDEDEAAAKAWLPFGNPDAAARAHIARHDPARVLREVESKRRIVDTYTELRDRIDTAWREYSGWLEGSPVKTPAATYTSDELAKMHALEDVLKILTLPHANHPEYNESWRP